MDGIVMAGFDFIFDPGCCKTCPGNCCCGDAGNIWVTMPEINKIADFFQMNRIDFIAQYLCRVGSRYSLLERSTLQGLECIFYQGQEHKCAIYALRPSGCRSYPFWEHFKTHPHLLVAECPGIVFK